MLECGGICEDALNMKIKLLSSKPTHFLSIGSICSWRDGEYMVGICLCGTREGHCKEYNLDCIFK